jgi:hypothetical protein
MDSTSPTQDQHSVRYPTQTSAIANQIDNLNTMSQNTHELPKHLGAWPCRLVGQQFFAAPNDDSAATLSLALVEYEVTYPDGKGRTGRLYLDATDLTRITPAEPETQWVLGADSNIWERCPGAEPGTNDRLWRKHGGSMPATTWPKLTAAWDKNGSAHRIVPLMPDPFINAPELPCCITTGDGEKVAVEADPTPSAELPVRLVLADNWTWMRADEAEQVGLALIAGALIARKRMAS